MYKTRLTGDFLAPADTWDNNTVTRMQMCLRGTRRTVKHQRRRRCPCQNNAYKKGDVVYIRGLFCLLALMLKATVLGELASTSKFFF